MKFSVLMSLYHAEQPEYLRRALASLAAQTLPADDVVVVFDGAVSDALADTVADFQAALPLNVVRLPENVGLGRALAEGLRHCRHDWVMRMDSDDVAVPERFALQCAFLADNPHIALLGGQIAEFAADPLHPHSQRQVPLQHAEIVRFARRRNPFNHMTVALRRSAAEAAGGYRHFALMEDYDLWLRMLWGGVQAANLPDVLVLAQTGGAMLQRRRGADYAASEWRLFGVKRRLGVQAAVPALYCCLLRCAVRFLPQGCLKRLYARLRKRC